MYVVVDMLQQVYCSRYVVGGMFQQVCFSWYLQQVCCSRYVVGGILQQIFVGGMLQKVCFSCYVVKYVAVDMLKEGCCSRYVIGGMLQQVCFSSYFVGMLINGHSQLFHGKSISSCQYCYHNPSQQIPTPALLQPQSSLTPGINQPHEWNPNHQLNVSFLCKSLIQSLILETLAVFSQYSGTLP